MFGRSLAETMQVEARLGGTFVPILLYRCIKFLREYGKSISDNETTSEWAIVRRVDGLLFYILCYCLCTKLSIF